MSTCRWFPYVSGVMVMGLTFGGLDSGFSVRAAGGDEKGRSRLPLKVEGIAFEAESMQVRDGIVLVAKGVTVRFEEIEDLEMQARRLEWRIGSERVELEKPLWRQPEEKEEEETPNTTAIPRLRVQADKATLAMKERTWRLVKPRLADGSRLAANAEKGRYVMATREFSLTTVTVSYGGSEKGDESGAESGSESGASERYLVTAAHAKVQLSAEWRLLGATFHAVSGTELNRKDQLEAEKAELSFDGTGALERASASGVILRFSGGHVLRCTECDFRPR